MTEAESEFEPLILAFCCNWCSYAGADLAGTARISYPTNIRIIRVMCSGMVHPALVMDALSKGIDGVLIAGCHPGDCHYTDGNLKTERRAEALRVMMEDMGIEVDRLRLEWVSSGEGEKFARVVREMTEELKKIGPNPFKPR
ncbi:MAG TPA: hydrogenase iron-sulfur subunit [Candidatus Bathyarchaeia archaeon]|nr:hydrogenase iron-sulfur subunit [Candidatus Bathyarchaeia archaeon]